MALRKAKRSSAKPLIGIYAESGTGKTLSALYLARGFVGPRGHIAMIETEQGRGEAYADLIEGGYSVETIDSDFSPRNYGRAIASCEDAKVDALIIDSASHEWEGLGGVLDMADQNKQEGKKSMQVWQQPKMDHQKHFVGKLLQSPIPLVIICMRAKYPMREVINQRTNRKEWVRSDRLVPKQSEDILYELFVHGWIDHDHKWHSTKVNRTELRDVFVDGEPISVKTGVDLANWASGNDSAEKQKKPTKPLSPIVDSVVGRIRKTGSTKDLQKLGKEISEMTLTDNDRAAVKKVYVSRLAEIKSSKAQCQ